MSEKALTEIEARIVLEAERVAVERERVALEREALSLEIRKHNERAKVEPRPLVAPTGDLSTLVAIAKGDRGETGAPGIPGVDGQHGRDGEAGPQGAEGSRGVDGAPGTPGLDGRDGAPGPRGPAGPQGPQGDPGVPGIIWRGVFSFGFEYVAGDAVAFDGSSWVAKEKTTVAPTLGSLVWDLLAKKGEKGDRGASGSGGGSYGPTVASAITVAPEGSLAATNVQAAFEELQADVSALAVVDVALIAADAALQSDVDDLTEAMHDPVSVGTGNGLSVDGSQVLTLAAAGAAQAGAVTDGAQEFGGAKTLTGAILAGVTTITEAVVALVRAVGVSLVLRSSLGAGSTDECVVFGTSETDGGTHASAKVAVFATNLAGVKVNKVWIDKAGNVRTVLGGAFRGSSPSNGYIGVDDSVGCRLGYLAMSAFLDSVNFSVTDSATHGPIFRVTSAAAINMKGLDRTATIGADTQNKPSGLNTIALGATTCRITNSLVPNPATAKVKIFITPHGNLGTWWVVQGSGYFDLTLAAGAAADTAFSWQVNGLL